MDAKRREASLEAIRSNNRTRVILISFKAGGAGLNLTACNNVILVDLWWNPALEVRLCLPFVYIALTSFFLSFSHNQEQAFGRVHRYGQERDVMIFKLTIERTVEQRILGVSCLTIIN